MKDLLQAPQPVALDRPRGAHKLEAFSPKLNRRLTFSRRCAFDQWILIETDPAVRAFCERPGYVQLREQRQLADFWVSFVDRQELILLPGSVRTIGRATATSERPARSVSGRSVQLTWRHLARGSRTGSACCPVSLSPVAWCPRLSWM
jgi:hypothetical protein